MTTIGLSAFAYCSSLETIEISDSVKEIGKYAFRDCSALKTVYYTGTADEWAAISIKSIGNDCLTPATVYYYSESQPTDTTYKYWRYIDGVPTPWTT